MSTYLCRRLLEGRIVECSRVQSRASSDDAGLAGPVNGLVKRLSTCKYVQRELEVRLDISLLIRSLVIQHDEVALGGPAEGVYLADHRSTINLQFEIPFGALDRGHDVRWPEHLKSEYTRKSLPYGDLIKSNPTMTNQTPELLLTVLL